MPFTHRAYGDLLQTALTNGYRFAGFDELGSAKSSDERICFLRHDCDNDLVAARDLARIERDAGVCSTWFVMLRSAMYNLLSPTNKALVAEIRDMGHWIGLHFDEKPLWAEAPDAVCAAVDEERALLGAEFGVAIDVVSFHQPSPRILANAVRTHCLNTYDGAAFDGVRYLSDSNMRWDDGGPPARFAEGKNRLMQLLIHPEWWTVREMPLDEKWNEMLRNNIALMQGSLLEREATFTALRAVSLGDGDA